LALLSLIYAISNKELEENKFVVQNVELQKGLSALEINDMAEDYLYARNGKIQNKTKAAQLFLTAAKQNNIAAQNNIGFLYSKGYGVKKNLKKAFQWFHHSAKSGHPGGQSNLALAYTKGLGVKRDFKAGFFWSLKAAQQGEKEGQVIVGLLYYRGMGVKQSTNQANFWFQKAANQGDPRGQYYLGQIFFTGSGDIPIDYSKAFNWFSKSAKQGYPKAQEKVGIMYNSGMGVRKSFDEAVFWLSKSSSQKRPTSAYNLACVYALEGEQDLALIWLDTAIAYGYKNTEKILKDPDFDSIKHLPDFSKILEEIQK